MSGPILFFIAVVVIDLVLKSVRDKKRVEKERDRKTTPSTDTSTRKPQIDQKRSGGSLRELKKMLEDEFQQQTGDAKDRDTRMDGNLDTRSQSPEKDIPKKQKISRDQARENMIKNQKDKVSKHSELEQSRRLQKEQMLTKARLSDSQITLASQHVNGRKIDDFDFGTRKPLTIELKEKARAKAKSKSKYRLNIKEDIIKGIVYSEILGKPKSMKK